MISFLAIVNVVFFLGLISQIRRVTTMEKYLDRLFEILVNLENRASKLEDEEASALEFEATNLEVSFGD